MNKSSNFMMFLIGAAIGSVATWQYTKKKYEKIAQEEIDSVKEVFSKRNNVEKTETDVQDNNTINECKSVIHKNGYYTEYSEMSNKTEPNIKSKNLIVSTDKNKPYIISPEEFGELDEYTQISLTYYDDDILADDMDNQLDDIEDTIGVDSLEHFGEYEDDSVFVRNDRLKCDYEILRDQRKYSDVIAKDKVRHLEE